MTTLPAKSLQAVPLVSRETASGLFQKIVRDAVINDGLITEWRDYFDMATWQQQTGG